MQAFHLSVFCSLCQIFILMVVHFLVDSWSESLPRPLVSSRVLPRACRALTSSSWHDVALNCSRSLFLRPSLSLLVEPSFISRICLIYPPNLPSFESGAWCVLAFSWAVPSSKKTQRDVSRQRWLLELPPAREGRRTLAR